MNQVELFLKKQDEIIAEDREKTLIALGLVEKEYSPDGKESYKYSKCDYVNGQKRYYREVALSVTDEEYELIIFKSKQVEAIKAKRESERAKEDSKRIKKWIPIFVKPKEETLWRDEKEEIETGKSKVAKALRIYGLVFAVLCFIFSIVIAATLEAFWPFLVVTLFASFNFILIESIANILDYLAEMTSIAKYGYKYDESKK